MFDGEGKKNWQPVICSVLIFYGTSNQDVIISIPPVIRQAFCQSVNSFGEKIGSAVAAKFHHIPTVCTPCVCIGQQKIRSKTGKYDFAGWTLIGTISFPFQWQVKSCIFVTKAAVCRAAIHFILTIDIAVFAAGTDFSAAMPWIPVGVYVF